MAYVVMPATASATCGVQWCQADDHETDGSHYTQAPPVEVHELVSDKHTVLCVDLVQPEDGKQRISITAECVDIALPADDARRFALAILAQLDIAER